MFRTKLRLSLGELARKYCPLRLMCGAEAERKRGLEQRKGAEQRGLNR